MPEDIVINKGVNIRLVGKPADIYLKVDKAKTFSVKPSDFHGIVPKLCVKAGDSVKAGDPLFYSKNDSRLFFSSPTSGEISDIVRGEKRKILEILIRGDQECIYRNYTPISSGMSADELKAELLSKGLWPFIKQRPFDIIADPDILPKAVFISAIDTAPISPDYEFLLRGKVKQIQKGIDVLKEISNANIYVCRDGNSNVSVFDDVRNIELVNVFGPHPAGNVGVQINKISPINKGETVWTINPQDLAIMGNYFITGKYDLSKGIALSGSGVKKNRYIRTVAGASVSIISNNIKAGNYRIIGGNVLTGTQLHRDDHIGFYDNQITVIPEGNKHNFFGWIMPSFEKFSIYRANYFSWCFPRKEYNLDTNLNGEERALVVTGQYEKVFPMDIYPMQLLKAIMVEDIELMEKLGIYEVAPEDFALVEFVCPSKIEIQSIVREGLDVVRELG